LRGSAQPDKGLTSLGPARSTSAIREAVEANRIELHLQPIVTLPQRKVRYYEALARLRTGDGTLLAADDFIALAQAGALMPRVDDQMVFRCVQVVRRLISKNQDVGLFCNLSASTLADVASFAHLIEFMSANRALASALVFELAQSAYRKFGKIENESLAALASLGFRWSLDHIADLKFEPRDLADRGFRFVKVPAPLLLARESGGAADIHPADLAGLLERFGIDLMVEKIENEAAVADLLDHGVKYGQGYLFAPPRPVRAEVLNASTDRTAALPLVVGESDAGANPQDGAPGAGVALYEPRRSNGLSQIARPTGLREAPYWSFSAQARGEANGAPVPSNGRSAVVCRLVLAKARYQGRHRGWAPNG
jgi:cyclic-di-GMP phosphodiesterase, flagellum assembly factor TipF